MNIDHVRVPSLNFAQVAAAQGLQTLPPAPSDEPEQKLRARDKNRSPRPWWQLIAFCATLGCCAFFFIIIAILLSSSRQNIPLTHSSHTSHSQLQYIPSSHMAQFQTQDIEIFYYDFVSGTEIQSFQRHPSNGNLPDINITQLIDYRVCCTSISHKFVCSTGNSFLEHGLALDAVLELDDWSEGMFLLLWINNEDLVEVGCVLSGSMRPGPS